MTGASRALLGAAALLGLLSVGLGAFGAHGLKAAFTAAPERAAWWQTATQYAMGHALAVGLAALVLDRTSSALASTSGWAFVGGVVVFSGTLYAMALGAPRWLGAVTPLGGLSLLAGWAALGVVALRGAG